MEYVYKYLCMYVCMYVFRSEPLGVQIRNILWLRIEHEGPEGYGTAEPSNEERSGEALPE